VLTAVAQGQGQLAITEVCDGTLTGGQPKWVQLTNVGDATIPDLSAYALYNFNNGGCVNSFDADPLNAVSLAAGDHYVIAYEFSSNTGCDPNGLVTCFEFVYGFAPDQFVGPFTNGDDVYCLFQGAPLGTSSGGPGDGSDALLVDVYGVWGTDGSGTNWEYTDSHAFRCEGGPQSVWTACDWIAPGPNTLETGDDTEELALLQTITTPDANDGCVIQVCDAAPYCKPLTSTNGCQSTLSASQAGMPASGASDFVITADGVEESVNGLFFVSINGAGTDTAFSGGTLCVRPPLGRSSLSNSGGAGACTGSLSFTVNDPTTPWGQLGAPGVEMWVQGFFRDSGSVAGLGLTGGLYVRFQ